MTAWTSPDAVVVGAGIVGACCAYELALAGVRVTVVDRGHLASGASASGEGNLLVSDKLPGPELDLALASLARWRTLAEELDADVEYESKGGVVVASRPSDAAPLLDLAERQREAGVDARPVDREELLRLEPHLAGDLDTAVHYPQDAQLQPVLAATALLRGAVRHGATVQAGTEVEGFDRDGDGRLLAVRTSRGTLPCRWVVNAAGPWSAEVAALAGIALSVRPRKGHVLVTEPRPPTIRHKVYEADYVGTLTSSEGSLQVSSVVEGTRAGTILIGSSREFVGFDRRVAVEVVCRIARRAVRLFPSLADVRLIRAYVGFRPWVPDHLPIVGEEPGCRGLIHATGHEGAGIGLAPATGQLVRALVAGGSGVVDPTPFRPDRSSLQQPTPVAGAAADG